MSRENNSEICQMLFNQIEKPKNFNHCHAINVYSNKYRVNVYIRQKCNTYAGEKLSMDQSYFCILSDNNLIIKA